MVKKTKQSRSGSKPTEVLLEGIDNKVVEKHLQEMLEENSLEAELDDVKTRFVKAVNSPHCKLKVHGAENKLVYGTNSVRGKLKAEQSVPAKPTMPITCMIRSCSGIQKNWINVTEETREHEKNDKIGLAGSWRKCVSCNRIWDTASPEYGDMCPKCNSMNSVVLAQQAAPKGTQGIISRDDMRTGDISIFNQTRASIFLASEDDIEEAFVNFSGKQQEILGQVRFGQPFDINVSSVEKDLFVNDVTGLKSFSTTGTSKVSDPTNEMPDILEIYESSGGSDGSSLIHAVDNAEDGTFCTFYLEIAKEAEKYKEGGKWVVGLIEPSEDPEEEPISVTMYIEDEDIAKQFVENDAGIFECQFSKNIVNFNDETKETGTINITPVSCGVPVYLLGEDGETKFIEV